MSSNPAENRPIRAELVAEKLRRVHNFDEPAVYEEIFENSRFEEALWFLQWVSVPANYPGGLKRFADDLIADAGDLLGTEEMLETDGCHYSVEQRSAIVRELPRVALDRLGFRQEPYLAFFQLAEPTIWDHLDREEVEAQNAASLKQLSRDALLTMCVGQAQESLATFLRDLCEMPHKCFTRRKNPQGERIGDGAPWYFPRIAEALLRFMDRRKARVQIAIAETEVTRLVFEWLDTAQATRRGVMIEGNSRFGKTESVKIWCAMNPGRARLVNTPAAGHESELLREVARALGMNLGTQQRGYQLREAIATVLQESGLMLVFDEAQFILPANFSRNTAPARLNWIRRSVIDAGLPVAFITTPQSYHSAKKRYVKATGYAVEQFDERLLKTVHLPQEISREDLLAIARIHFPGLPEPYLAFVVEKAASTERNYVSDVEKIAALARYYGTRSGHPRPTLDDIKAAVADVLPSLPDRAQASPDRGIQKAPQRRSAPPVHYRRSESAGQLQEGGEVPLDSASSRITFSNLGRQPTPGAPA